MYTDVPDQEDIGSDNVNDFSNKADGVWYPYLCGICMVWNGGKFLWDYHTSKKEFNPFIIHSDSIGETIYSHKHCIHFPVLS